jgi:hypothetical protein
MDFCENAIRKNSLTAKALIQKDLFTKECRSMEREHHGGDQPTILRGMIRSLTIYDITDSELENLSKGSSATLDLNFAIGLCSSATSFLIALLTSDIKSSGTQNFFYCATILGFVLGSYLFFKWFRQRRSVSAIVNTIRERASNVCAEEPPVYDLAPFLRKIRDLEESHKFLSVKWLRENKFSDNNEAQEALQICIDKKYLETYRLDNPKNPKRPVLCCRLNHNNPEIKRILDI